MKKFIYGFVFILLMSVLSGCNQNQEYTKADEDSGYKIYYLNNGETKLVKEFYTTKSSDQNELIGELLKVMDKNPENLTYKKAKPENIFVKEFKVTEDGQLTLNFESNYELLTGVSEVLCRAAIVKTLCQINGVESIEFNVDDQPLMDENEKPFGFMTADDFIDYGDEEGNSNQNAVMTLFFANPKGNQLIETRVKVKYDGTVPMEQLIIEQLMAGPDRIEGIDKGSMRSTIPDGTVLLNSSIKDGVCYVDFNESFLERLPDITGQVAIYSVVNTLVEMSNVNKVQFTINGKQVKTYTEKIELDVQFERDFEIVMDKE